MRFGLLFSLWRCFKYTELSTQTTVSKLRSRGRSLYTGCLGRRLAGCWNAASLSPSLILYAGSAQCIEFTRGFIRGNGKETPHCWLLIHASRLACHGDVTKPLHKQLKGKEYVAKTSLPIHGYERRRYAKYVATSCALNWTDYTEIRQNDGTSTCGDELSQRRASRILTGCSSSRVKNMSDKEPRGKRGTRPRTYVHEHTRVLIWLNALLHLEWSGPVVSHVVIQTLFLSYPVCGLLGTKRSLH